MFVAALAASVLTLSPQAAPAPQDPVSPDQPVALEDITVTGRPLQSLIDTFVGEVAEPNRGRALARWEESICVGVANLKQDAAQYLVDRISTVAEDVGLNAGAPGCTPNVLVIATDDGQALAETLVTERRRAFRMGGAGMDRGGAALRDFSETPRPVRWWQLSMPVDAETGMRATRLPGDCSGSCTGSESVMQYAPNTDVFAASRLISQTIETLFRAIVIVDVDEVSNLSIVQLADYIAMVTMAQIDPDADTQAYSTILNVFSDPTVPGLTDWDTTYLAGLYSAERNRRNPAANRTEIARSIRLEHRRLQEGQETAED